jgi:hypothetical protein
VEDWIGAGFTLFRLGNVGRGAMDPSVETVEMRDNCG